MRCPPCQPQQAAVFLTVDFGGGFSSQVFAGLSQQLQVDELPKQPNVPRLVAEGLDLGG